MVYFFLGWGVAVGLEVVGGIADNTWSVLSMNGWEKAANFVSKKKKQKPTTWERGDRIVCFLLLMV